MNLPAKRRGLSPEGRQIRERHQGSLTIGLQGITVHPAERSRNQHDFLQDNVRRLHEIQARCRDRENNRKPQPLRATRESSASTTSSLKQVDCLAPIRNGSSKLGRRSPSSEYEGSAHSDYFSLTDEQIESAVTQLSARLQHNGVNLPDRSEGEDGRQVQENGFGHQSRSSSVMSQSLPMPTHHSPLKEATPRLARTGSPVMLRPISSSRRTPVSPRPVSAAHRQNSGTGLELLSGCELNHGVRKMRMDNLLSKIRNRKPACEMDYNTHYRNIENQHKLLLDNSDMLSLYGYGEGSNGIDTQRSVTRTALNTAVSGSKPAKLVRARSFDRDALSRKSAAAGRTEKSAKSSTKSDQRAVSSPSPQLKKRFSKSSGNLAHAAPSPASEQSSHSRSGSPSKMRSESSNYSVKQLEQSPPSRALSSVQSMQRTKSNLESPRVFEASIDGVSEAPQLDNSSELVSQYLENESRVKSSGTSAILNRTASSGDLNLNSTMTSDCNFNISEPDQSISCNSALENLHLDLRPESQVDGDMRIQNNNASSQIEDSTHKYRPEVYTMPYNDIVGNENVSEGAFPQEEAKSSTPVPNEAQDLPSVSSIPKLLKKREQHGQPSSPSTLRRSQSMKNIRQRQGEPPSSYKRGKLPKYLLARKEEEKRLAEIARSVDPECPPGHAPLPDHERRNTLHLLRKSQADVMRELSSLPVAQDTLRVKKRRQDLEDKLMQIEDGLRIFSQPKVYVMNDD
ncbi:uncharacterized protein LOC122260544 isoform X2 [Penaeus japonicus]|uniref:uncharacterized protein LOC122252773 isoform X2 n=1 Tax=Penaeus japonicus TaxID=27405 RepID=UPI001C716992|nr:uncharacterized protein LOC122252773 isoform X2 [Penaeus japonicus]XP_042883825.1 uncharacterized protein LOC122260544 isoform X2 [Penaeus japonicus]